jgi:hypothetical protein
MVVLLLILVQSFQLRSHQLAATLLSNCVWAKWNRNERDTS